LVPAWRPYAATVREDEEDPAVVAGDGGDDEWPWPWELVRWSRHLKDPAWVAGAQTHLGAPWPWLRPEDADDQLLRIVLGDAAAPVGVVLWPWSLPSSTTVST
jgi:hypothetical protein